AAGLVVDRMGEILMLPIGPLAARHGHEQTGVTADDLETPDDEGVVEGDADESLQLVVVAQRNPDLGDFNHATLTSEPSLERGSLRAFVIVPESAERREPVAASLPPARATATRDALRHARKRRRKPFRHSRGGPRRHVTACFEGGFRRLPSRCPTTGP